MGCNCKKNVNKKYLSDEEKFENELRKLNGIEKVGNTIGQFFFGLIISSIVIIGLIPFLGYLIFCLCFGREMGVRIPNFRKWFKK